MKLPVYFVSDNHFFMDSPSNEKERRELLFSLFSEIKKSKFLFKDYALRIKEIDRRLKNYI